MATKFYLQRQAGGQNGCLSSTSLTLATESFSGPTEEVCVYADTTYHLRLAQSSWVVIRLDDLKETFPL